MRFANLVSLVPRKMVSTQQLFNVHFMIGRVNEKNERNVCLYTLRSIYCSHNYVDITKEANY